MNRYNKSKVDFQGKLQKQVYKSVILMTICIHLQEDDGGQYRCTARNEGGEVSLTMNLDIASPISVGKHHT